MLRRMATTAQRDSHTLRRLHDGTEPAVRGGHAQARRVPRLVPRAARRGPLLGGPRGPGRHHQLHLVVLRPEHPAAAAPGEIFAAAPPELTRSISLQHTLQLVRVIVEVVEDHSDRLAAPGCERDLREAVLRYSREVAFSAAEVYARAAEARGAWDARLEALVVDALVRGDDDDALRSRVAALGWSGHGSVLVMVGTSRPAAGRGAGRRAAPGGAPRGRRRARRHPGRPAGRRPRRRGRPQGRGRGDRAPVRSRPRGARPGGAEHRRGGRLGAAALAGLSAAPAWPSAPRPVLADDLLPERVLVGDPLARAQAGRAGVPAAARGRRLAARDARGARRARPVPRGRRPGALRAPEHRALPPAQGRRGDRLGPARRAGGLRPADGARRGPARGRRRRTGALQHGL